MIKMFKLNVLINYRVVQLIEFVLYDAIKLAVCFSKFNGHFFLLTRYTVIVAKKQINAMHAICHDSI